MQDGCARTDVALQQIAGLQRNRDPRAAGMIGLSSVFVFIRRSGDLQNPTILLPVGKLIVFFV
jgi:hypothetical protein